MAHIEKGVIINVPPQKVFDYVADPATMHEWISGLVESKDLPDGPVNVGQDIVSTSLVRNISYLQHSR